MVTGARAGNLAHRRPARGQSRTRDRSPGTHPRRGHTQWPGRAEREEAVSEYLKSTDEVVAAYVAVRSRVIDLIRSRPDSDGRLPVPHCPKWTVAELVAHMVGVPEDIVAGRMDGVTTDAWTQAQVERHRGESLVQLAEAWEASVDAFDGVLPAIPAPVNSQLVLDAVTHEHDLRHALGVPGGRTEDSVAVAVGWILHTAEQKSPGLAGRLQGSGLGRFDLLRVATGRRSREQIVELGVDPDLVATLLAGTPLSPPATTIAES